MTSYLQTAGWTLVHFVWQGAAIAGAAIGAVAAHPAAHGQHADT